MGWPKFKVTLVQIWKTLKAKHSFLWSDIDESVPNRPSWWTKNVWDSRGRPGMGERLNNFRVPAFSRFQTLIPHREGLSGAFPTISACDHELRNGNWKGVLQNWINVYIFVKITWWIEEFYLLFIFWFSAFVSVFWRSRSWCICFLNIKF